MGLGALMGLLLFLAHLLLHTAVHFPESFLDLAGSPVHGYHQVEDKLVQQVSQEGIKNILHTSKISCPAGLPPAKNKLFTEL